jgi:hypothetical protein
MFTFVVKMDKLVESCRSKINQRAREWTVREGNEGRGGGGSAKVQNFFGMQLYTNEDTPFMRLVVVDM